MTALALVMLAINHNTPGSEDVRTVDVFMIEFNDYGVKPSHPSGTLQVIFWNQKHRVMCWSSSDTILHAPLHLDFSGYLVIWLIQDDYRILRIRCRSDRVVRTWGKNDPEVDDRKFLPIQDRKGFLNGSERRWNW